jgi:HK97 gp10 family phage protein
MSHSTVDAAETQRKLAELLNAMSERDLDEIVLAGAMVLEGDVKADMAKAKGGRTYARGGKTHRASAPGESPAVDYGGLINSILVELEVPGVALVGTNQEYAQILEEGTARMEARPFMRPAVERRKPDIENAMRVTARRKIEDAVSR